jgi:hypothetical protein
MITFLAMIERGAEPLISDQRNVAGTNGYMSLSFAPLATALVDAVNARDLGIIQGFKDFGFPLKTNHAHAITRKLLGRILIATSRLSFTSQAR